MYPNFGTITNTTINADGYSVRFHSNSMSPFYSCNRFINFRPCVWGYGFPIHSPNSFKFGAGVAVGMFTSAAVMGLVNKVFNA